MAKQRLLPLPNVNFRWDNEEFASLLADSATEAGALSPHTHARELLKSVLMADDTDAHDLRAVHQEIARLRDQISRVASCDRIMFQLREDHATGVYRLLVEAGGVEHQEAVQWVQETLLEPKE